MNKEKAIKEYLKMWPIWVSIIMIFVPGLMYQLDFQSVDLNIYNNILIIIFFVKALYYSIPFFALSILVCFATRTINPKNAGGEELLILSVTAVVSYRLILWFESFSSLPFWWLYVGLLLFFLASNYKLFLDAFRENQK